MNTDLAAQKSLDRLANEGFDALTETEKTLATVWQFAAGVGNSGFAGYLSGHRGDLAFNAPTALRAIGASELAAIAAEANAMFGPAGPAGDRETRRAFVHALSEETRHALTELDRRFLDCEEDADELLERYLAGS